MKTFNLCLLLVNLAIVVYALPISPPTEEDEALAEVCFLSNIFEGRSLWVLQLKIL